MFFVTSHQRFPRSRPTQQAVSAKGLLRFLDRIARERIELHSLMLVRHGHVVAEGWWNPYRPDLSHRLFSLSKSFTSTAVGFAWAEGRLRVDDPVLSFFPEEDSPVARENMRGIEVRHLLMMGTGHVEDTSPKLRELGGDNWVHGFFQCPVQREPGTHFVYNNGATYMLSAIVQRVTGQTLLDYLTPRLFRPLGIDHPTWESCPRGINRGYSGLKVTTEDIAAFGQLYLDHGRWRGEQLIPEAWVAEATKVQLANGTDPNSDWAQGYGYQFWRSRHGAYRGDGAYGQFCFVMPDQDAVLALTSGMSDMRPIFDVVWDELLPALATSPLSESPADLMVLEDRLQGLTLDDVPESLATSAVPRVQTPRRIITESTSGQEVAVTVEFATPDVMRLAVVGQDWKWSIDCGLVEFLDGQSTPMLWDDGPSEPVLARAIWVNPTTLEVVLRFYETPFCQHVRLSFDGRKAPIQFWTNTSPGNVRELRGRWAD